MTKSYFLLPYARVRRRLLKDKFRFCVIPGVEEKSEISCTDRYKSAVVPTQFPTSCHPTSLRGFVTGRGVQRGNVYLFSPLPVHRVTSRPSHNDYPKVTA